MATALTTTFSEVTGTPVMQAFSLLLDRFGAVVALERGPAHSWPKAGHDAYCDAVEAAHRSLMDAALAVLAEDVETPLDGPLRRLALIIELQMSIVCPEERQHMFQTVQNNRDVFRIIGQDPAAQIIRGLQDVFFTYYTGLFDIPETVASQPDRSEFPAPVPA